MDEINNELIEFFKTIKTAKKEKEEETKSLIGDSLENFFTTVKVAKKETKDEFREIIGNSFLEDFVKPLAKDYKQIKEQVVEIQEEIQEELEKEEEIQEVQEEPKKEQTLIEKSLGLLSEPSNKKMQNDPLTPLDQKFATLDDLNKHYNTFLSRIQQQLSTLGGGGETNLAYMDMPLKYITSSSYTLTPQDYYIGINYAGAVTITLPTPRKNGKTYIVKDELGEASKGVNRYITILPSGSDTIDGRDRAIIAYDYGSLTFVYRNGWRVV